MSNADAVIAALRTGHDDLAVVVSGFGDDDLARPSAATEWDIAQVLSHLGSGAEISQARLQAAIDGKPAPGHEFNLGVWDRWNAKGRREQADGWLRADETLMAMFESMDAATREELRIDMGFLPEPVDLATAGRMRLNELALHSWDVRVSFDSGAALAPDATGILLHGASSMLPRLGKADALGGKTAVVKVTTTEPASAFTLRLQAPVSMDVDVPDEPDGTLALPAEAWLRLVTGRLGPQYTPASAVATGAVDLDLLRRVFPGY